MGTFRTGSVAQRAQSLPLLSFLAPSIPQPLLWHPARAIAAVSTCQTLNASAQPQSQPEETPSSDSSNSPSAAAQPPRDPLSLNSSSNKSRKMKRPDFAAGASIQAQIDSLLEGMIPSRPPAPDSASDMRQAYRQSQRKDGEIARRMKLPGEGTSTTGGRSAALDILDDIRRTMPINPRSKRTIRSRPQVGRTIELDPGKGVTFNRALSALNGLIRENNIRKIVRKQRFHERPGLKRKRLKRERWRKLFMSGFRATTARIKMMRRQGW